MAVTHPHFNHGRFKLGYTADKRLVESAVRSVI